MRNIFYQAETELRRGRYKNALKFYQEILRIEPQNAYAYQGASLSLSNLGQYTQAYEMANRALEINPDLVLPHVVLAYAYDESGEKEKSREEARIALKKDPNSADVLCCFGVLSLLDNNLEAALEYLEKAVTIDPLNYLAQYNLAAVYQNQADKKLFAQSIILLRLKPSIRNFVKIIYLSARLHRFLYFSTLLLSGLASLLIGPQVILVVTLLLMLIYIGTGLFMTLSIKGRPQKAIVADAITGISIGLIGFIMYFWAIILLH